VHVRSLDEVHLDVRLMADQSITLADAPLVCFVGPFSAPDDAGLSDPCWGDPDLGKLLSAQLPRDGAGHFALPAGQSIDVAATLRRGTVRCDYPPGAWLLKVAARPLIDGSAVDPISLPDLNVDVPYVATDALPLLPTNVTRYCGLASVVYR